jgi:Spy/CpxP family protein refolding chaperone
VKKSNIEQPKDSMKTRTFLKYTLVAASLLAVTVFQAAAQGGGGGGGGGRGGGRGGRGLGPDATDEQNAAFMQMNTNAAVVDLRAKMATARTALNDAIYAAKVDEAAIKAKAADVAKIDADLAVAQAKAFDAVRSKFTAAQIDTIKTMGARGGFAAGGFGGGAGRGGGGRRAGGGGGGGAPGN